jgi:hypothetical protein
MRISLRRSSQQRTETNNPAFTGGSIWRGGAWYRRAILCAVVLAGCAGARSGGGQFDVADTLACQGLEDAFSASGWRDSMEFAGRVKLDVKQYRVQGRFNATSTPEGNFVFEFTGTMAMGSHHENVIVSFHDGDLYVLDRERGRFYEGDETVQLMRDGIDLDWDMAELIRRITARPPPCERLSEVAVERGDRGRVTAKGRVDGESFSATFQGGRIRDASWPVISQGRREDRLKLDYEWRTDGDGQIRLERLEAFLDGRRWRMILEIE